MPKKIFNSDLETSGQVIASTLTDGTATLSGGVFTASTLTDGSATLSGGVFTASTLTDGTATLSGGVFTASTLTDGTATLSGGVFTASTITDGTLSINSGEITAGGDITINATEFTAGGDLVAYRVKVHGIGDLRSAGTEGYRLDTTPQGTSWELGSFTSSAYYPAIRAGNAGYHTTMFSEGNVNISLGTLDSHRFAIHKGDVDHTADNPVAGGSIEVFRVEGNGDLTCTGTVTSSLLTGYVRIGDSTSDVNFYSSDFDELAIGSVNRIQSRNPLYLSTIPQSASQVGKTITIGSDKDKVIVNAGELYLFASAGLTVNSIAPHYTEDDINVSSAKDFSDPNNTTYDVHTSGDTRSLVWVPNTSTGSLGNTPGKVLVANVVNFTGEHRFYSQEDLEVGNCVCLDTNELILSSSANSTTAVGIIVGVQQARLAGDVTSLGESALLYPDRAVYEVAAVGDSRHRGCQGFNVCNENGDIQPGDLLVTSNTPGYLMKQDDDIMRSKTVGKAMEAVTFDNNGQATGVYGFIYCG